ncbi:S53 family peptidase [Actinoplanes solisilvae]|uniref:S53 family peptidase n=1 Tax=Actinoplanes solisilvae TaxID=2486853 RepID=UPI000FD92D1B|nr:S53 family peptidase [Actinoplanes solisilvae]
MRLRVGVLIVAVMMTYACAVEEKPPVDVSLPIPKAGVITFYLSLPSSDTELTQAATAAATPGSGQYRRFVSQSDAAAKYGASDDQITAVADSIKKLGLGFAADPSRLFGRVSGSADQWQTALRTPLAVQAATAASPFTTYSLPNEVPDALEPSGTSVLTGDAQLYDPSAEGNRPPTGARPDADDATPSSPPAGAQPFPLNTGTPSSNCSAGPLQQKQVYTPTQVQTAYGIDALRRTVSGTPIVTIVDLGGGWRPSDLQLAGECFGYKAPVVAQRQGDGVPTAIANADTETALDLQNAAAVAPGAQMRLVQATPSSMLDAFSRAIGDSKGQPDVISVSYGGCALTEESALPAEVKVINSLLAMIALTGTSTFVAAGDSGSTTCGPGPGRTTLSYPAVSPFVTAVGGTRLAVNTDNVRTSEVVWNDSVYGENGAGGGAVSRKEARPWYQNGAHEFSHRAVPDVSALADIVPGWPVVTDGALQPVGGTSGSAPLTAAAAALVAANERNAGRPPIGLANGWFYQAATQPSTFFDVTKGNNDLAKVGCCTATTGYDPASGLGVPNWATLPGSLPPPG